MTTNAMATFYDTHAHLDYPDYANDLPEVITRAQAAGITKMISIGTSLSSSERAIRLAEKFPSVYAAVGWHPTEVMKAPADLRPALREYAKHPKVVAIGEIGLDYHHLPGAQERPAGRPPPLDQPGAVEDRQDGARIVLVAFGQLAGQRRAGRRAHRELAARTAGIASMGQPLEPVPFVGGGGRLH